MVRSTDKYFSHSQMEKITKFGAQIRNATSVNLDKIKEELQSLQKRAENEAAGAEFA